MVELSPNKYKNRFGILYKTKVEPRLFRQAPLIALDIMNELRVETPVDTGWAVSNWIPTIGFQVLYPVGVRPESTGQRQIENSPESEAGMASLLAAKRASGRIFGYRGAPIHIVNNVPYIVKLDSGTSEQAPRNFVLTAVSHAMMKARARRLL